MEEDLYTRITLRIPRDLDAKLDAEAVRTSKSKNAEIVSRLAASFSASPDDTLSEAWELTRALNRRRDMLSAKLSSLSSGLARVVYDLQSAASDGLSSEDVKALQQERRKLSLESYSVRRDLDQVLDDLDKAYSKVEGLQPVGAVRITRED